MTTQHLKLLLKLLDAERTGATPELLAQELGFEVSEIKELLQTAHILTIDSASLDSLGLSQTQIKAYGDMFKLRGLNLPEKVWMVCYPGFRVYCMAETRDDAVEIAGSQRLGKLERIVQVVASETGPWNSDLVAEVIADKVVRVEPV